MTGSPRRRQALCAVLLACGLAAGCAGAQKPVVPPLVYSMAVYPVADYPLHTTVEGIEMAVTPWAPTRDIYADPKSPLVSAAPAPLNVLEAGVLLVRVIISNQSRSIVVIEPTQATLASERVAYLPYKPPEAAEVVIQSAAFKQAIKGTSAGPLVQSVLGGRVLFKAVTGALSGVMMGGLAGGPVGAAAGGPAGAAVGAGNALAPANRYEKELAEAIRQVYSAHALPAIRLLPGYMAEGLLFFPSHSGLETLRIVVYDESKARPIILSLRLQALTPTP